MKTFTIDEILRLPDKRTKTSSGKGKSIRNLTYYQKNKEKIKSDIKKYSQLNKKKILENKKKYYLLNKEKIFKREREYRNNNREKINDKAREKRNATNKAGKRGYGMTQFYLTNKAGILEYQRNLQPNTKLDNEANKLLSTIDKLV